MGRMLALDHGSRRVGVALGDPTGIFARPLGVLAQGPGFLEELKRLIGEHEVDSVLLGLPVNMDGTLGPKAQEMLRLRDQLEEALGLPVITWDERLTTMEANRRLSEGGLRGGRGAGEVDRVAAQIRLQSYLDSRKLP